MADQVSQSKLFIDVGGVGGSSRELLQVKTFDVKDGRSVDVTLSIGGHKGFRRKEGGFEIDMTSYREIGQSPEVDWRGLKAVNRVFTMTQQDEFNGLREAFTCMVSKIDSKADEQGVHEDTITLAATYSFRNTSSLLF
jgi:hypothetical protein